MDSCLRDGLAHTGGRGFAVLLAPHGDIAVNMTAIQDLEIVFGAIPRIRRQLSSLSARVKPDLLQHWLELMRVAGQVCQSLRHDHLVIGIDSCLGVIALDKSVPRLHDATVWIGEIVLGAVVGGAGRMCRRAVRRVLALLRLLPYRVLCVGFQFRFRGARSSPSGVAWSSPNPVVRPRAGSTPYAASSCTSLAVASASQRATSAASAGSAVFIRP